MILDVEQGSTEWFEARLGRFTASNFGKLFMKESTQGYQDLINQVVYERLTGTSPETFKNEWMDRGTMMEGEARLSYQLETGNKVIEVGFGVLDSWIGASPDGLSGEDGMVELKCPKYSTLMDLHMTGKISKLYYWQMQGQMYVFDRQWCDFYSYDPNLKPFLKRIERNEEDVEKLKEQLNKAIELVESRIKTLEVK